MNLCVACGRLDCRVVKHAQVSLPLLSRWWNEKTSRANVCAKFLRAPINPKVAHKRSALREMRVVIAWPLEAWLFARSAELSLASSRVII